jgi:hypothetical protein
VAACSEGGGGLQPLACWDCGFETCWEHECLPLVSVWCCRVEVSATGRSLVQRSPTECGVSERDRRPHRGNLGLLRLLSHEKMKKLK